MVLNSYTKSLNHSQVSVNNTLISTDHFDSDKSMLGSTHNRSSKTCSDMKNKVIPSEQTQQEAMTIAKATQKPGQTKEQTKLIAQGIEKGIALYKKQQKEKNRQADKAKKKVQKAKQLQQQESEDPLSTEDSSASTTPNRFLPWLLLAVSWIGFAVYWFMNHQ